MKITSVSVAVALMVVAVLALAPAGGSAQSRGGGSAPVTVVNTPLQVTGGTPAQFALKGGFQEGDFNLHDTSLGPRTYTIPAGFSRLLLKHVSCEAILVAGHKVQIFFETELQSSSGISPESLIQLIPDNEIFGVLPQPRQVANAELHAYLGITTPGGSTTGDTIRLNAQRDTTSQFGGVTCVVAGELQ